MNYTELEIIEIAKNAMNDIEWGYNTNESLIAIFKSKEEQIENLDEVYNAGFLPKAITYDEAKSKIKPYWIIGFDFEEESEIFNNKMFMEISNDTGEPYYIRHKQAGMEILKNGEEKYFLKDDWVG